MVLKKDISLYSINKILPKETYLLKKGQITANFVIAHGIM